MNKRITSIVLCLVMLISLVAAVVPVSAAGTTSFKMTADVSMIGFFAMLLFAVCGVVVVIGKKSFVR